MKAAAKLPPHGYEGKRATAKPAPKLPSAMQNLLDAGECEFTPVSSDVGAPVRLHHRGICAGVFSNREAANPILGLIARS